MLCHVKSQSCNNLSVKNNVCKPSSAFSIRYHKTRNGCGATSRSCFLSKSGSSDRRIFIETKKRENGAKSELIFYARSGRSSLHRSMEYGTVLYCKGLNVWKITLRQYNYPFNLTAFDQNYSIFVHVSTNVFTKPMSLRFFIRIRKAKQDLITVYRWWSIIT